MRHARKHARIALSWKKHLGLGFDFHLLAHTGAGAYECGRKIRTRWSAWSKRRLPADQNGPSCLWDCYGWPDIINNGGNLARCRFDHLEGGRNSVREFAHGRKMAARGWLCIAGHINSRVALMMHEQIEK